MGKNEFVNFLELLKLTTYKKRRSPSGFGREPVGFLYYEESCKLFNFCFFFVSEHMISFKFEQDMFQKRRNCERSVSNYRQKIYMI